MIPRLRWALGWLLLIWIPGGTYANALPIALRLSSNDNDPIIRSCMGEYYASEEVNGYTRYKRTSTSQPQDGARYLYFSSTERWSIAGTHSRRRSIEASYVGPVLCETCHLLLLPPLCIPFLSAASEADAVGVPDAVDGGLCARHKARALLLLLQATAGSYMDGDGFGLHEQLDARQGAMGRHL